MRISDWSSDVCSSDLQEKSLKRIEVLLAQADDIAQIVRIESELSTRQANLDSLKQQQTWLKDQTSMSTITVNIPHTSAPEATEAEEHTAFVRTEERRVGKECGGRCRYRWLQHNKQKK